MKRTTRTKAQLPPSHPSPPYRSGPKCFSEEMLEPVEPQLALATAPRNEAKAVVKELDFGGTLFSFDSGTKAFVKFRFLNLGF